MQLASGSWASIALFGTAAVIGSLSLMLMLWHKQQLL
jgi:hypothetical protein